MRNRAQRTEHREQSIKHSVQSAESRRQNIKKIRSLFFFCSLFSVLCPLSFASPASHILDEIPVQHKGRIKPFQSFAREASLRITGAEKYQGVSASELIGQWMSRPEEWNKQPMIPVVRMLQADFPMMVVKGRLSPEVILRHRPFMEKVEEAWAKREKKETLYAMEKERLDLYDRANSFHAIAAGALPGFIAHPGNPHATWFPLQALSMPETQQNLLQLYSEPFLMEVGKSLGEFIGTLRVEDSSEDAASKARAFRDALRRLLESQGVYIDPQSLQFELSYNRLHPFGWAWKFYLMAAGLFGILIFYDTETRRHGDTEKNASPRRRVAASLCLIAFTIFSAGFFTHLTGFVLRCLVAGRPPVTNMYESIIWVSWAAVFFSIILFAVYRAPLIPLTSSLVAAFALLIAESFPAVLDPSIAPLVPVLRSNLWLTVHVLTITLSYGAFALAWGLGHVVVFKMTFQNDDTGTGRRGDGEKESELHRVTASPSRRVSTASGILYRALQIGVILLASGTVLGGVWANYSWGRFWGWDPKETWALIALLGYLVVLHGRFAGWLDSFGAAAASVIAFTGVVMAWYGVNFVLAAGLHSYGFGGGGAPYVIAVALADLMLILALSAIYGKRIGQKRGQVNSGTGP